MKPTPPWALALAVVVGLATIAVGTVWLASWIALPLLKVPMSAHKEFIFLDYWRHYPALREGPLAKAAFISFGLCCAPFLLFFTKKQRSLHGDAKFATTAQVKKAGLLADKGIIVGKRGSDYLVFGGQQHVLMSAPTRSGKGVGVVIPNLLNWPDSVVVLDIKQENWDLTAGFRAAHGQACYLFNPAAEDRRTHRYNPLDYISNDPAFRINDAQKISSMLYPDLPGVDPIWNASCRSLFVGIVLYLKETPTLRCTLGQVLRSTLTSEDTAKHFKGIIEAREAAGVPLSAECVAALNDFVAVTSDNTRSSIKKTFTSRLELFLNPVIDAATAHSDFDLRDLRKRKISLYVGITPDNLDRLQPIVNLLFQQILDQNTRELPNQNSAIRYSCLLLMDEFTAIGRINVLSKGISYIAGYNLRMLPIIQSPAQLREVYGKDAADTFTVNHALQIVFAPREVAVAKEISEALGYETVKSTSLSKAKNIFAQQKANISISDQRRALLLPQEVRDIGNDNALLLLEGTPPIQCQKIRYYEDKMFTERLMKPPQVPTLQIGSTLTSLRTDPTTIPIASTALAAGALSQAAAGPVHAPAMTVAPTAAPMVAPAVQQADPFADAPMLMPAASDLRPIRVPAPFQDDEMPTTIALTSDFDPFADPEDLHTNGHAAAPGADPFADLTLDFSSVEIAPSSMSVEELRRLHQVFLSSVGADA